MKTLHPGKLYKSLGLLLSISLALGACTKERPYKSIYVDEDTHTSKTLLTEAGKGSKKAGQVYPDDLYLYFPSTVNVSRTTTASRPHWAGDAKLVKIKFTKDALKVVEVEKDDRFKDNELNNAPVLTLPIKHVAFKCREDADGKCTNEETENNDISWEQKDHFQILVNDMKVEEVNFFPEQLNNLFFPCNNNIGQEFVHYDVSEEGLNVQIDKTYQANILCAGNVESLSDLTFKVRYHFSLIKLNTLVKEGYKPLAYLKGEENTFGFFDTRVKTLDADNNSTVDGEKAFVNRWRPGRQVVYHLTENFNKPENAAIKKATLDAVKTINNSLKKANARIELVVAEPSTKYREGDLRINSIILEEDPLATGIIGYGPSIADPMTGELVNARTVMYLGTIKKYIKNAYEDLVLEKISKEAAKSGGQAPQAEASIGIETAKANLEFESAFAEKMLRSIDSLEPEYKNTLAAYEQLAQNLNVGSNHMHSPNLHRIAKHSHNMRGATRARADVKGQLDQFLRENCMYDAELFNFSGAIEADIDKVIAEVGLKPWVQLTTEQKEKVIAKLLPYVWIPTFVHEVGHNLGLRHNFGGSEDKANFYSAEELKDIGVSREFKYSSIMDYSYKTTNELSIMGKYDVAALRFGYAEQVETADGKFVQLDKYRKEKPALKPYNFCTDEHVGINPNCNVFDEGTSLTEIVLHHAKAYEENYFKRNYRNNRLNFSLMQDVSYAGQVGSHFDAIRATFERYESIKHNFSLADNDPIWNEIDFLKDLKNAVQLSAAFLNKVITTPDLLCGVAEAKAPTQIVGLVPLKDLAPTGAVTCFDSENVQLNPAYVIVAQGGKLFQSAKDPRMQNPYIDQIDVRGVWVDKLLAIETLAARKTGIASFDDMTDNMLDVADIAKPVQGLLESVVRDEVVSDLTLVTRSGQVLEARIPVSFYSPSDAKNGHMIPEPLADSSKRRFGIENAIPFHEHLVKLLKAYMPSRQQNSTAGSFTNSIRVLKALPQDGQPATNFEIVSLGGESFVAHKTSPLALEMVRSLRLAQIVETGDEKAIEEALKTTDPAIAKRYADQGLKDSVFYAQVLRQMAK